MEHPRFVRQVDPTAVPAQDARWFIFAGDQLVLVERGNTLHVPDTAALAGLGLQSHNPMLLGLLDGVACFAAELAPPAQPPLQALGLRQAYGLLPDHEYSVAGYAAQIGHWERTTRFCPVCATATEHAVAERAKRCPACGFTQYPRVSPAIIVLIYRPGQVLLARQPQWPTGHYSLVAGFVESGESLEACVRREVAEEVGVAVTDIRYLGSQPWPFPHQLMCGFVARYDSGDIAIDTTELEHAAWFALDALPNRPPALSIARRILDWHLAIQHEPQTRFPDDPLSL
jgi:NAD+ diphosphatase